MVNIKFSDRSQSKKSLKVACKNQQIIPNTYKSDRSQSKKSLKVACKNQQIIPNTYKQDKVLDLFAQA